MTDAYEVLGISQDATPAQVRQAYHRAVRDARDNAALHLLLTEAAPTRGFAALTRITGQVLRVHPDRAAGHPDPTGFERVQSAWESLRVRTSARHVVALRARGPEPSSPQDSSSRARYDALSKPHEVRRCVPRAAAARSAERQTTWVSPHCLYNR